MKTKNKCECVYTHVVDELTSNTSENYVVNGHLRSKSKVENILPAIIYRTNASNVRWRHREFTDTHLEK